MFSSQTQNYPAWSSFFNKPEVKQILEGIDAAVDYKRTTYPPIRDVFNAFNLAPTEVKVVILGQDPYYTEGSAHGLAFSVKSGKINPSLRNIKSEVINCGFTDDKEQGDLSCWVKEGVFLINTALTVLEGDPGSHIKIWSKFTRELISFLDDLEVVFLLWGDKAQNYKKYIKRSSTVCTVHPSPLSAYRGFLGSKCFETVNAELREQGKGEIDWGIK